MKNLINIAVMLEGVSMFGFHYAFFSSLLRQNTSTEIHFHPSLIITKTADPISLVLESTIFFIKMDSLAAGKKMHQKNTVAFINWKYLQNKK